MIVPRVLVHLREGTFESLCSTASSRNKRTGYCLHGFKWPDEHVSYVPEEWLHRKLKEGREEMIEEINLHRDLLVTKRRQSNHAPTGMGKIIQFHRKMVVNEIVVLLKRIGAQKFL